MGTQGALAGCRLPVIVQRIDDAWVAECIPLDLMTQGDSLEHALDMVADAIDLVVDDDLGRGVNPLQSRRPSPEALSRLSRLMAAPLQPIDIKNVGANVSTVLALVDVVRPVVSAMGINAGVQHRYEPLGSPSREFCEPAVA